MALDSPTEQRALLALSFEPLGSAYVYYHHRWSQGIPVTAEEREAYLRLPAVALMARHAWRKSLAGRQPLPPRSTQTAKAVRQGILLKMPPGMAVTSFAFGALGLVSGFSERNIALAAIYVVVGVALLLFAAAIALAKIIQARAKAR